jgi:hypothetical protein
MCVYTEGFARRQCDGGLSGKDRARTVQDRGYARENARLAGGSGVKRGRGGEREAIDLGRRQC